MFSEYFAEVQQAIENAERKTSEYSKKRESLALSVKAKIDSESESIAKNSELKNYSPIEHHNEMTAIIHSFEKMKTEESSELLKIKELLHASLLKIMKIPEPRIPEPKIPELPIKEMYKIISSSSQNNNHICRVWFTLEDKFKVSPKKILKCQPGDPIRIEWLNVQHNTCRNNDLVDQVTSTTIRHASGPEGIKIPQFDNPGRVTSSNSLYDITNWGATSNQRTWWEQWLANNRPL
jgi:hypothetical protein